MCSPIAWNIMTACGDWVEKEHHWTADSPNCESGQYGGNQLLVADLWCLGALVLIDIKGKG